MPNHLDPIGVSLGDRGRNLILYSSYREEDHLMQYGGIEDW